MNILNSVIDIMASEKVKASYKDIRKESIYYSDLFKKSEHLHDYKNYLNKSYSHSNKVD